MYYTQVISYITSEAAEQGLLAIPCIVGQISQIFAGAAMAPYIAKRVRASCACTMCIHHNVCEDAGQT